MPDDGDIAYISDVGAFKLKPLFIAGSVVTTLLLDSAFLSERWLRHRGRLVRNTSTGQRILVGLTVVFAIVGTCGLILLSVFDTYHHSRLHNVFLLLFIGGYMLSAIFTCWEYQRLGISKFPLPLLFLYRWSQPLSTCPPPYPSLALQAECIQSQAHTPCRI